MKTLEEIKSLIQSLPTPNNGYNLIEIDSYFWGKNYKGEFAFGFPSKNINVTPLKQSTKHLKLFINHQFTITINGKSNQRKISLLVLNEASEKHIDIFIRISLSMADNLDEEKLLKHFLELKDVFSNDKKISKTELEGMFGELFVMYALKTNYGIDISIHYQKEDRRKFDFNLTDKKKIEVKTTLKSERIHHFLHQQLDSDKYDIRVISVMLQKDDAGMSLLKLINKCKNLFSTYFTIILHLELITKNVDDIELDEMRFNLRYANHNMKIFDALKIPRLNEKDIEGVFNVEYDVDLTNTQNESIEKFINWTINRTN